MIVPSSGVKVLIAMKPVDFRKGMDGLAAVVHETLGANPFGGVIYVFRSKRAALGRKNYLFAGSDEGGRYWAIHASLIETCKMNDVDPQAWLADVLDKIANRHPMSKIDELLPWAYINNGAKRQAA